MYFVLVIGSVGFLTLFERKVLGFSQNRISVNKNTYVAILQPLLDGLKLFIKIRFWTSFSLKSFFILGPGIIFVSYYFCWEINNLDRSIRLKFQIIFLLCILGVTIYGTILGRLVSFNKYSLLRGIRIILQTVCFEINITVIFFFMIYTTQTSNFGFNPRILHIFITSLFFLLIIVETIRACFDMGERERELVRGFNLEFAALLFVLIFLSEYSSIIFMCFIFWSIFRGRSIIFYCLLLFFFIFVRCFIIRLKIDFVISFIWLKFLPYCVICLLMFL